MTLNTRGCGHFE